MRIPWRATGLAALLAALFALPLVTRTPGATLGNVAVRPTLEDLTDQQDLYSSSTQSFLRQSHWLETVTSIDISLADDRLANVDFQTPDRTHRLALRNVPLDQLVPRLHYPVNGAADDFDAFNLMMAEYARNGLSVPVGSAGDAIAHFETTLSEDVPWTLAADYQFLPNAYYRPLRVSIVNNCLAPGLWELAAQDTAGELYHAWFSFPRPQYLQLVARTNRLDVPFVERALEWSEQPVPLDLDRLRAEGELIDTVAVEVVHADVGYSSQDSRRKLAKRFLLYEDATGLHLPQTTTDILQNVVKLSDFVPPGKYSFSQRKPFDYAFLAAPRDARVLRVEPRTSYGWNLTETQVRPAREEERLYIELQIDLGSELLIIGNLPLDLLVPQEEYAIHGFGVGVLAAQDFAERRSFLIADGHRPSFAYLAIRADQGLLAVNSHDRGIEQVYLRSFPDREPPYWELVVTSFERIADLVKYRVPMPESLWSLQRLHARRYTTPVYLSYRDDNVR